jgi:hypothetical protein
MESSINMGTGYNLITSEKYREFYGKNFYKKYHDMICSEISKNNIMGVNGLLKWVAGYYVDNKRIFEYALINASIEMFLMIYYTCLFLPNDGDDKKYMTYENVNHLFNDIKYRININSLILNELNYVPKDVIGLMSGLQFNVNIIDYQLKYDFITKIFNNYGKLWYNYNDAKDNDWKKKEDEFHMVFVDAMLKYGIDIKGIDNFFYNTYGEKYAEIPD